MSDTFVLYIDRKHDDPDTLCDGSQLCMMLVEKIPKKFVTVQNCSILRKKKTSFPDWLTGTPTLLIRTTNQVVTGSSAISTLKRFHDHISSQPDVKQHTNISSHTTKPLPPTPPPPMTSAKSSLQSNNSDDEEDSSDRLNTLWQDDDAIRQQADEMESRPKLSQSDIDAFIQARQTSEPAIKQVVS
jgi:hypothetical protein